MVVVHFASEAMSNSWLKSWRSTYVTVCLHH